MKLTNTEIRFMNIIWERELLKTTDMVTECAQMFDWSRSTTYTFIKRLENKGALIVKNSMISSTVTRNEVQSAKAQDTINVAFNGSLPSFLATFINDKKISQEETQELLKMIEDYKNANYK